MTVDRGEIGRLTAFLFMASSFRGLRAYELASELSADVRRAVVRWDSFDRWSIGIQLVRAASSVGANIAEATGRRTTPDKRQLLMVARGSLFETEHFLLEAERAGLVGPGWRDRIDELGRTLNGLINKPVPR